MQKIRNTDYLLMKYLKKILKNVPQQNKKYVEKQLNELDKNFMDYLGYWNEKYYRNGFCDGISLIQNCE